MIKKHLTFLGLAFILTTLMPPLSRAAFGGPRQEEIWRAAGIDHSHKLFDQVLKQFVKGGLVDYPALKSGRKNLDQYLDHLAQVSEEEFKHWTKEEQIAFLINLYNASTLRLIVDHYPVQGIRNAGNVFFGPWDQPVVRLFGSKTTLNSVEHGRLRKNYREPRIHFALVCAARGCPPLRNEAYVATRLNEQLEDQGRKFFSISNKNSVDPQKLILYLSPIFKWFADDFIKSSGSVQSFVQPYLSHDLSGESLKKGYKIHYTDYDWSLNDARQ